MNKVLTVTALLVTTPAALAQSDVFGINLIGGVMFQSTTTDFGTDYVEFGSAANDSYALDFNADGSQFYAITQAGLEISTFDVTTGFGTPTGQVVAVPSGDFVTGLTCTSGGTWYLTMIDTQVAALPTFLYEGDVATSTWTLVGEVPGAILIDISADSQGRLFGLDLQDRLVEIDPSDASVINTGALGANFDFAQGMDVDWSDDTLYATAYYAQNSTPQSEFVTIDTSQGVSFGTVTSLVDTSAIPLEGEMAVRPPVFGPIGTNYCQALPNSTGNTASISAVGMTSVAANDLTLTASGMPPLQFGIFICSETPGQSPLFGGNLCVSGNIIRFQGPGLIQQADANGEFSLQVDILALPAGVPTPINPGENWHFQAWFRDTGAGGAQSANFTDGVEITFN